jgi:hypothetical protein
MIKFKVLAAVTMLAAVSGCGAQQRQTAAFHGDWQKICTHPSMSAAAYREAFACHQAARKALIAQADSTRERVEASASKLAAKH